MAHHTYGNVSLDGSARAQLGDIHNHYYNQSAESLAVLGFAATSMQCLDLLGRFVSAILGYPDTESTFTIENLESAAEEIEDFLALLSKPTLPFSLISASEDNFKQSLAGCTALAKELLTALDTILESNRKSSTLVAVLPLFKKMWDAEKTRLFDSHLRSCRSVLTTETIALLNKSLGTSRNKSDPVLGVIAFTSSPSIERGRRQYRHEAQAAITTHQNGRYEAHTAFQGSDGFLELSSRDDQEHTLLEMEIRETSHDTEPFSALRSCDSNKMKKVANAILNALCFRSMNDRASSVASSHEDTFHWIFDETNPDSHAWHNFSSWLKSRARFYWINGKAGSGKSTLLNFMLQDPRLDKGLMDWAGSAKLIKASYFFWYAGEALHKTHAGLLRSLLFHIADQKPELTLLLFPEICRHILMHEPDKVLELTEIDLKRAFVPLSDRLLKGVKLFLMIDGIDEYEGDDSKLFDLISPLAKSDSIKVVMSSRPTSLCMRRFGKYPSLRLQDLTRNDIRTFAEDELRRHPNIPCLDIIQPGTFLKLVQGITEKASGVFLWVALAVKRLIIGLDRGDRPQALLWALKELPKELEEMYDHMLRSIDKVSLTIGTKIMRALSRSIEIAQDYPLTLLQLFHFEDVSGSWSVDFKIHRSQELEEARCRIAESQLAHCCHGLLEVQEICGPGGRTKIVGFLHRTVYDFLKTTSAVAYISDALAKEDLTADILLVESSLLELHAKADPGSKHEDGHAYFCAYRTLKYLTKLDLEDTQRRKCIELLTNILSLFWHDDDLFPGSPLNQSKSIENAVSGYCNSSKSAIFDRLLLSAALQCPSSQMRRILDQCWELQQRLKLQGGHTIEDLCSELSFKLIVMFSKQRSTVIRQMVMRSVLALCTKPETLVSMKSMLAMPWDDTIKKSIGNDKQSELSLWRLMLHLMNQVTDAQSLQVSLGDVAVQISFCNTVAGLLDRGASAKAFIFTRAQGHQRGYAREGKRIASTIIFDLMKIAWKELQDEPREVMSRKSKREQKQHDMFVARLFGEIEARLSYSVEPIETRFKSSRRTQAAATDSPWYTFMQNGNTTEGYETADDGAIMPAVVGTTKSDYAVFVARNRMKGASSHHLAEKRRVEGKRAAPESVAVRNSPLRYQNR